MQWSYYEGIHWDENPRETWADCLMAELNHEQHMECLCALTSHPQGIADVCVYMVVCRREVSGSSNWEDLLFYLSDDCLSL